MKAPRENDVLRACLELLRVRRIFCWRQNQGAIPLGDGRFRKFVGMKGVSDILAVLPPGGRLLAVETKRPDGGRLTDDQRAFLEAVCAAGGLALVVDDVAQLIAALEEADRAQDPA